MSSDADTTTIPLAAEEIDVGKRRVASGRVRVTSSVETVDHLVRENLTSEQVSVERVPVDREIDTVPEIRVEGDVTIIPVIEEVLVVEKRLMLKEELHLRRVASVESVEIPVTTRRQHAEVEHLDAEDRPHAEAERKR